MIQIGKYKHYKGQEYEVMGLAHDTETRSPLVLYKPLYRVPDLEEQYANNVIFARPLAMFKESVMVNGTSVERFKLIGPLSESQT
tara:strand:- start:1 stop:255 length:255 start_codon:yes stop_codon:yes gene_type:complete